MNKYGIFAKLFYLDKAQSF